MAWHRFLLPQAPRRRTCTSPDGPPQMARQHTAEEEDKEDYNHREISQGNTRPIKKALAHVSPNSKTLYKA